MPTRKNYRHLKCSFGLIRIELQLTEMPVCTVNKNYSADIQNDYPAYLFNVKKARHTQSCHRGRSQELGQLMHNPKKKKKRSYI